MKVSENWLRDLASTTLTTDELVAQLTMAGLEVDGVERHGDDNIIDIDLTPNRADCISIQGVARELKAIANAKFTPVKIMPAKPTIEDTFSIKLAAPEGCSHYVGRVIKNVNNKIETPKWMFDRLEACGIQPISPVVDVTNYVMLELGQPMHAFDLDHIEGDIDVRCSKKTDAIDLIKGANGVTQIHAEHLDQRFLLIADSKKPLAIAGIKGGEFSKVTEGSQNIFLESAYFTPSNIAVASRRLGVHTDSAYRFARGVDPMLQLDAIERATELLLAITGGEAGPVTDVVDKKHFPKKVTIDFRPERANQLLGLEIEDKKIKTIFENLGMQIKSGKVWQVTVPTYRFDLTLEEDLIEEIARVVGYEQLPATLPAKLGLTAVHAEQLLTENDLRKQLVSCGYQEVMTYSFIDKDSQAMFSGVGESVELLNPVSKEMAVMRKSLWPSLVKSLQYNLNRQMDRVRIFEVGTVFLKNEEKRVLSGLIFGGILSEQWRGERAQADFYSLRSDLESLFDLTKAGDVFSIEQDQHTALHPGQTAVVKREGKTVGYLGALHPKIAQEWDLPEGVFLFELNLESLLQGTVSKYKNVSKFPSIRRDLAFIVNKRVEYGAILKTMKAVGGELLVDVQLFDVYQGQGIQLGQKSMAFGLILQDFSRTLKEEEVAALLTGLVNAVQDEHDATLRK